MQKGARSSQEIPTDTRLKAVSSAFFITAGHYPSNIPPCFFFFFFFLLLHPTSLPSSSIIHLHHHLLFLFQDQFLSTTSSTELASLAAIGNITHKPGIPTIENVRPLSLTTESRARKEMKNSKNPVISFDPNLPINQYKSVMFCQDVISCSAAYPPPAAAATTTATTTAPLCVSPPRTRSVCELCVCVCCV